MRLDTVCFLHIIPKLSLVSQVVPARVRRVIVLRVTNRIRAVLMVSETALVNTSTLRRGWE